VAFRVRLASRDDHPVFARLFPELGVPDPLPDADQFAAAMLPRVLVLEEGADALGYAFWQVYGVTTHVVHVVVDRATRGRRAGEALLDEVRVHARSAGCARWYLNVKQDNASAIRLYERMGLRRELEGWAMRTTWAHLATLPGEASDESPRTLEPDEDAAVAARFDLDIERLALLRSRPGEVLRVLGARSKPVAFAGFAPGYPGVYPIRVARPGLARPLFDALSPHARHPHLHVFVEGDRALHELLGAAGAQLEHATFRMGAPLA
jgi:GNAT superfamily N-acetyltransferase